MNRVEVALQSGAPEPKDSYLRSAMLGTVMVYLMSGAPNPADSYLLSWPHEEVGASAAVPVFPTQYPGLRCFYQGAVHDLCLVATADAPVGDMPRIMKNGTVYAIYLVDTADPDASPVRIQTDLGVRAIRELT